MTRTCRVCDQPRAGYTKTALCREHYLARRRVKGPHGKRGRPKVEICRECGGPRKPSCHMALCEEHYRVYVIRASRKQRGTDPDGPVKAVPVKAVDTTTCSRCDQPRLPYGNLCRACHNARCEEQRRKRGQIPVAEHLARIAVPKGICRTTGCGQSTTTRTSKFCRVCYLQRQQSKVTEASRAKMTLAAKAVEKQVPRRWDTALPGRGFGEAVVVGPEAFARPEPVQPTRPVTRVRAADADEREAREREWAEWLSRRTAVARP